MKTHPKPKLLAACFASCLVLSACQHADVVGGGTKAEVPRKLVPPPNQEQAQAILDEGLGTADEIVVEAQPPSSDNQIFRTVWRTRDGTEIRNIAGGFLLRIPPPKKKIIDGVEHLLYEGHEMDGHIAFVVRAFREHKERITIYVWSPSIIACPQLHQNSGINVESAKLLPLFRRVEEMTAKRWKSRN